MRYEDALAWLYARQRFGIKQGLENVRELLAALEDPQESFAAYHVTGSNGKGAVCAFLDSALRAAGHSVGRYISPHLTTFTERVTVDGRQISRSDVALLTEQLAPVVAELESRGVKPTFFEVVTALAFLYFRRRRVPVAVVEVGMGGRWDATNLVKPCATVVTNVSLEHTDRLGSTPTAIAAEKAGILKEGVPVVTRAAGDAYDVIRARGKALDAPLQFINAPDAAETLQATKTRLRFRGEDVDLTLALLGKHQAENAALAAAALEAATSSFDVDASALKRGFESTRWPGRLERASKDPLVLLDGAHNPAAAKTLAGFVERVVRPRRVHALFGVLRDKDVPGILRELSPAVDRWVTTTAPSGRALDAAQTADALRRAQLTPSGSEPDVVDAIRLLHRDADRDDVLLVTGSLFLVGAARAALLKAETDPPLPDAPLQ